MFLNVLGWVLVATLMVAGFAGCFIPMVPGTPLILAGAFVYEWMVATPGHNLGWGNLIGLTAVVVVSQIVEFVAALVGANRFGASKHGVWGALIGLCVGLFFSLPGILFGPIIGVYLGEFYSGKDHNVALRAAWGTLVGNAAGVVARVIAGSAMLLWIYIALNK